VVPGSRIAEEPRPLTAVEEEGATVDLRVGDLRQRKPSPPAPDADRAANA
jgi:hypothetical protein